MMSEARDVEPDVISYNTFLACCADLANLSPGVVSLCEVLFHTAKRQNIANVSTHNSLLNVYAKAGLSTKAERFFDSGDFEPNVVSHSTLLDALCASGDFPRAV